jgi:Kef-type K+ transport system membrane component KefB
MAVVYAVMLETGLNRTEFGKGVLASCFLTDLGTVVALGVIFAPFTSKTVVFIVGSIVMLAALPPVTSWLTRRYAHRTAAIRTKWVMLTLFGLGALALWSGSEAVLPAYLAGMVLAGSAARDAHWIRRLRTLTVGFLTPFYFLRAGTLVSLPAVLAAPLVFVALLASKVGAKIFSLYPIISLFRRERHERWYYTLLMSTGLTFGTISSLYGLAHGLVTQEQYSFLVAAVIASAVIPTVIAGRWFAPTHLLPKTDHAEKSVRRINGLSEEG